MLRNLLKQRSEQQEGFTLIEIVLVLAIAGLILVVVFLAVGGAQRARRDTQRVNDAGRVAADLEQFASNNNGDYTGYAASTGIANLKDPSSGNSVKVGAPTTTPLTATNAGYFVQLGKKCSGTTVTGAGARNYAIIYFNEAGSKNACKDNS